MFSACIVSLAWLILFSQFRGSISLPEVVIQVSFSRLDFSLLVDFLISRVPLNLPKGRRFLKCIGANRSSFGISSGSTLYWSGMVQKGG